MDQGGICRADYQYTSLQIPRDSWAQEFYVHAKDMLLMSIDIKVQNVY